MRLGSGSAFRGRGEETMVSAHARFAGCWVQTDGIRHARAAAGADTALCRWAGKPAHSIMWPQQPRFVLWSHLAPPHERAVSA
jgi:hypothetical protein